MLFPIRVGNAHKHAPGNGMCQSVWIEHVLQKDALHSCPGKPPSGATDHSQGWSERRRRERSPRRRWYRLCNGLAAVAAVGMHAMGAGERCRLAALGRRSLSGAEAAVGLPPSLRLRQYHPLPGASLFPVPFQGSCSPLRGSPPLTMRQRPLAGTFLARDATHLFGARI